MSEPRLVMVAGILVDVVMYVPHLPAPGGDDPVSGGASGGVRPPETAPLPFVDPAGLEPATSRLQDGCSSR